MSLHPMATKIAKVLGDNPPLAFELYCMASELVDDFEDYGPILQADGVGRYSETTTIDRLRRVRNSLIELLRAE